MRESIYRFVRTCAKCPYKSGTRVREIFSRGDTRPCVRLTRSLLSSDILRYVNARYAKVVRPRLPCANDPLRDACTRHTHVYISTAFLYAGCAIKAEVRLVERTHSRNILVAITFARDWPFRSQIDIVGYVPVYAHAFVRTEERSTLFKRETRSHRNEHIATQRCAPAFSTSRHERPLFKVFGYSRIQIENLVALATSPVLLPRINLFVPKLTFTGVRNCDFRESGQGENVWKVPIDKEYHRLKIRCAI